MVIQNRGTKYQTLVHEKVKLISHSTTHGGLICDWHASNMSLSRFHRCKLFESDE